MLLFRQTWLFALLPPLYLLTLYRELHKLAFTSLFAQVSNLLAFAVVLWFDLEHIHLAKEINPKEFSIQGFPFFFAVAVYCFEGAGMILSLEASLAAPIRPKFKRYFVFIIVLITLLYIFFGACGYLSFGPDTNAIITLNLPTGGGINSAIIVKACVCLALFFTYPVMMFPVSQVLEKRLFSHSITAKTGNFRGNILRLVLVLASGVVIILIPSFADLMALIGSTCCTLLAFILPAYFHMRIFKRSLSTFALMQDYWLIFLGIVASVIGTLDTFERMYGIEIWPELSESGAVDSARQLKPGTQLSPFPAQAIDAAAGNIAALKHSFAIVNESLSLASNRTV